MLLLQAEFAKKMNLAGGMVWSLETDDFGGKCHGERYPLIKTVYRTIVGPYPTYQWEPKPARSSSSQVCDYWKPTWVPQKYPVCSFTPMFGATVCQFMLINNVAIDL